MRMAPHEGLMQRVGHGALLVALATSVVACGQVRDSTSTRSDHPGAPGVPPLSPPVDAAPAPGVGVPFEDPCTTEAQEVAVAIADDPVQGVAQDGSFLYFATSPECYGSPCPTRPGSLFRTPLCGGGEPELLVGAADRNQLLVDAGSYVYWTGGGSGYVHGRVHKGTGVAEPLAFPECAILGGTDEHAYFGCVGAIRRVAHTGTDLEPVVPEIAAAITYRAALGPAMVLWTDEGATGDDQILHRATLDGGDPVAVGHFTGQPLGIAATGTEAFVASTIPCPGGSKACSVGERLLRMRLDGSEATEIDTAGVLPGSVAAFGRLVFWVAGASSTPGLHGESRVDVELTTFGRGSSPLSVGSTLLPASPGGRLSFTAANGWLYLGHQDRVVARRFEEPPVSPRE